MHLQNLVSAISISVYMYIFSIFANTSSRKVCVDSECALYDYIKIHIQ